MVGGRARTGRPAHPGDPLLRSESRHAGASPGRQDRDGVFAFDGFSEAWFTDRPTFERAHASPAWLALRDDAPNVFDMQALDSGVNMVVDESVIKG
jgi:hypothetical protein